MIATSRRSVSATRSSPWPSHGLKTRFLLGITFIAYSCSAITRYMLARRSGASGEGFAVSISGVDVTGVRTWDWEYDSQRFRGFATGAKQRSALP